MNQQQHHPATELELALATLKALQAENDALKANAKATPGLGIKVSTKGAVSVYGLGRFPITLYSSQWEALLARGPAITKFLKDNAASLKVKEA